MSTLEKTLSQLGISQADFARGTGLSRSSANRVVKLQEWPRRSGKTFRANAIKFLQENGATPETLRLLQINAENKAASHAVSSSTEAIHKTTLKSIMEDSMLLQFTPLTQAARELFGLSSNPFINDVQELSDVFRSRETSLVSASLEDVARNHSFMALVGESGSGKSTLAEALEEKLRGREDIIMIKPYVLAMEDNDIRGKTLKSSQIVEAIAATLAPDVHLRRSTDARFRQIHNMLIDSVNAGHRHLLIIEEAHCLPTPTLKHLKRFLELKDRLRRLMGILLIGQTELKIKLSSQNPEVREVAQRCEVLELGPLDNYLQDYLTFKLSRVGVKYEKVFEPDAVDAIRARLINMPRGGRTLEAKSICYPLVVNNLVSRAMNEAARTGFGSVSGDIITAC